MNSFSCILASTLTLIIYFFQSRFFLSKMLLIVFLDSIFGRSKTFFTDGTIPWEAEHTGGLSINGSGPECLCHAKSSRLHVQLVRSRESLGYNILGSLHGILQASILGRVARVQRQQSIVGAGSFGRFQRSIRAILRAATSQFSLVTSRLV